MELNKNEIKKELYKTRVDARLCCYRKGSIYYTVEVSGGIYMFPIDVVTKTVEPQVVTTKVGPIKKAVDVLKLSDDLGDTTFASRIPAKLLIRWMEMAIDAGEFVLLKDLSQK